MTTVSVVVCAYTVRRWDDLAGAVRSVTAQPETTELILVIDHEDELLARATEAWASTGVTVVANRFRQGLSGARNTGLTVATSDVVAFLDDDAEASEGWLRELVACFSDPDVAGVGGRAEPKWPSDRASATLPPELLWVVGCSYRGQPVVRADVRNVIGCSMAFRRAPLVAIGGFNQDTGRIGQVPLGGEETEVCIKLRQDDPSRRIIFEPASVVRHRVTPDRLTWRYLRRRSFYEGVSKAALSRTLGSTDALASERSYTARVLPIAVFRHLAGGRPRNAIAIVLSLGAAAAGYAYGKARRHGAAPAAAERLVAA